jgi:GGDEF domain-containing protein
VPDEEPAEKLALDRLLSACRVDPTTGLYAFTDFMAVLPRLVESCSTSGERPVGVGVAVGDVDGLKSLIESPPDHDGGLMGHLRGHMFMSSLGSVASTLTKRLGVGQASMATFGGDEIVLIVSSPCPMSFSAYLNAIRHAVANALPRSISFAWTWLPGCPIAREAREYDTLLMELDRTLMERKRARRAGADRSFCESVPAPGPARR